MGRHKLSVIGVTTVPLLAQVVTNTSSPKPLRICIDASQAVDSDLNGRLRAAGQKIFTATTVMEPDS